MSKATLLNDIIDSFCAKDLDRLRALADERIVYQETGTGRRVEGIDAYISLCEGWLTAFPDVAGKLGTVLEAGNQAAAEPSRGPAQTAGRSRRPTVRCPRPERRSSSPLRSGRRSTVMVHCTSSARGPRCATGVIWTFSECSSSSANMSPA